jgi:hypothetical protein
LVGLGHGRFDGGELFEGQSQREQVPGVAAAKAQSADRAFQVADLGQASPESGQSGRVIEPRLNGFLAAVDGFLGRQRLGEPIAQSARAHGGHGLIEGSEQCGVAGGVGVEGFEDLEIAQRDGVEDQVVGHLIESEARQVRHISTQMGAQVVKDGSGGTDGRSPVAQSESVQRGHFEVFAQGEHGGLW